MTEEASSQIVELSTSAGINKATNFDLQNMSGAPTQSVVSNKYFQINVCIVMILLTVLMFLVFLALILILVSIAFRLEMEVSIRQY